MLSSFHGPDNVTFPASPSTLVTRVGVTYSQWAKTTKCVLDFLKHWGQVLYMLISSPNTKYNAWCWKMPHKHWVNEWMNEWMDECHLPYIYMAFTQTLQQSSAVATVGDWEVSVEVPRLPWYPHVKLFCYETVWSKLWEFRGGREQGWGGA